MVSLTVYHGVIGTNTALTSHTGRLGHSKIADVTASLIGDPPCPVEMAFDRLQDLLPDEAAISAVAAELIQKPARR